MSSFEARDARDALAERAAIIAESMGLDEGALKAELQRKVDGRYFHIEYENWINSRAAAKGVK